MSATYDIGRLNASTVSRNNYSVTTSDRTDVFEFDVSSGVRRNVGLYLHGISGGDANLRLYRDSNRNGVFDASDAQVARSLTPGSDTIDFSATGGTYFAQVERSFGSRVVYDLDMSATYDVGVVGTRPVSRNNYSVTPSDSTDVFEFDILGTRNINLNLHDISAGDNANLRLFRDSNRNGVFDASDAQVASSLRTGNRDDVINYRATRGTYFAQVERVVPGSLGSATYDLDISATSVVGPSSSRASNLLGEEVRLGNLSGDRLLNGRVSTSDTTDTYSFSLGLFEGVNVRLNGLFNDADVRVIRDRNNNGIVDNGEVIGSSTRGGRGSELISNINQSGDYFVQVYQYSGNTPYRLTMDHYTTPFA